MINPREHDEETTEPESARDALESLLWPDADLTDTILENMDVVLRAAVEVGKFRELVVVPWGVEPASECPNPEEYQIVWEVVE